MLHDMLQATWVEERNAERLFPEMPSSSMMDDAINIETDSRLTALGAYERGRLLEADAGLSRAQASATKKAGKTAMMSTMLGGLASAGMSYANYKLAAKK